MLLATEDTGRGDHGYTAGGDGRSTHAMAAPMIRCGERKKNSQTKLLLHAFIAPGPGFRVQFCPCAIALRASFLPVCSDSTRRATAAAAAARWRQCRALLLLLLLPPPPPPPTGHACIYTAHICPPTLSASGGCACSGTREVAMNQRVAELAPHESSRETNTRKVRVDA